MHCSSTYHAKLARQGKPDSRPTPTPRLCADAPGYIIFQWHQWLSVVFQAPWLELDDGTILTQSNAIGYYCAEQAGMLPSDPWQIARTHELVSVLEEVRCCSRVAVPCCAVHAVDCTR